ncbi:MAG: hypothetical protein H6585_15320 [Flavobacteriales bacterium]|nr:hypothetical protein [Flavobacteriales bacterium]MCB9449701.1 hypothetical protein [Flavobacteriales bacterium]
MKQHALFTLMVACITACTSPASDPVSESATLKQTDLDMSALAAREGFFKALSDYAADDFVKLNDGSMPIIGKAAYIESNGGKPGPKGITWEPVDARVAASCDLGYTWGNWTYGTGDTVYYGNYFTAWRKGEDGHWHVALDGGNSTPAKP